MLAVSFEWPVFLHYVFHPDAAFARALAATVVIAVLSQFFGVVLGLISALFLISRSTALKALSFLYVLVTRGTPVLVQIFFVYFGLPLFLGIDLFPNTANIFGLATPGAMLAGLVALSFNEGGYMSEIIRAGIQAIDPGQMEAAKSLGMARGLALRRIILPQAARIIVPPLGNEFNSMLKTTSLLFIISVRELFADADIRYSASLRAAELFAGVAVWYLALTGVWTLIQRRIEHRLGRPERQDVLERQGWVRRSLAFRRIPGEAR